MRKVACRPIQKSDSMRALCVRLSTPLSLGGEGCLVTISSFPPKIVSSVANLRKETYEHSMGLHAIHRPRTAIQREVSNE